MTDKIFRIILTMTILVCLASVAKAQRTKETTVILTNVTVIDVMNGTSTSGMSVELRGGKILAITKTERYRPSKNVRVVDLRGRYLIPGFVDMHAHLFLHPWDEQGSIMRKYDRRTMLQMLRLLLAFGITTVRDPGSETEAAVTLRDLIENGKVIGPRVFTAGRMLTTGKDNPEPFVFVSNEEEVRREVRWQAAVGVNFIKVYSSMPPALVKAAIDEAHAHNLRVIGHLHRTTWTQAAEMGIDAVTHNASWAAEYLPENDRTGYDQSLFGRVYWLDRVDLDSSPINSMVDALVKNRVTVDPTLIALHTKFWGNDKRYLEHPQINLAPELFRSGWFKGRFTSAWTDLQYTESQARWHKALALIKKLSDRGVLLTVGTDTPTPYIIPGVSFHEELELLADAGITPKELLRMATTNGAEALDREKIFGQIKPGMLADLVVLQENPLTDIKNTRQIELVIKAGIIYEPEKLLAGEGRLP